MKRALKVLGIGLAVLVFGPLALLLGALVVISLALVLPFFLAWEATRPVKKAPAKP